MGNSFPFNIHRLCQYWRIVAGDNILMMIAQCSFKSISSRPTDLIRPSTISHCGQARCHLGTQAAPPLITQQSARTARAIRPAAPTARLTTTSLLDSRETGFERNSHVTSTTNVPIIFFQGSIQRTGSFHSQGLNEQHGISDGRCVRQKAAFATGYECG